MALKFSIHIAKRLFNGKSVSFDLACMSVAKKVGQKGQQDHFKIFYRKNITDD